MGLLYIKKEINPAASEEVPMIDLFEYLVGWSRKTKNRDFPHSCGGKSR